MIGSESMILILKHVLVYHSGGNYCVFDQEMILNILDEKPRKLISSLIDNL